MSVASAPSTRQLLERLLSQRILVIDGAMGTMVHALKFGEADFRGSQFATHPKDLKNFIDILSITQPEAIYQIHRQYLDAGADIIETNTFGATSVAMADFGLSDRVRELNLAAVSVARRGRRSELPHARAAPLRGWLDRSDEQAALDCRQRERSGAPRRHVRRDGRDLLRADRCAGERRRRHPAHRNCVRHAGAEGLSVRHRQIFCRS